MVHPTWWDPEGNFFHLPEGGVNVFANRLLVLLANKQWEGRYNKYNDIEEYKRCFNAYKKSGMWCHLVEDQHPNGPDPIDLLFMDLDTMAPGEITPVTENIGPIDSPAWLGRRKPNKRDQILMAAMMFRVVFVRLLNKRLCPWANERLIRKQGHMNSFFYGEPKAYLPGKYCKMMLVAGIRLRIARGRERRRERMLEKIEAQKSLLSKLSGVGIDYLLNYMLEFLHPPKCLNYPEGAHKEEWAAIQCFLTVK
jgi:hypothetical protein